MKTYTLSQIAEINPDGEHPARFAVIGNPVSHSLSPQLHQPALNTLKQHARYIRVQIEPGQVAEGIQQLHQAGILGINVTVPHKLEALESCHHVDPNAQLMGAVNTIVINNHGETTGFNTDGPGFTRAILEEFSVDLGDLKIIIIGAGGGAGRAIATQCLLEHSPQLILANRTLEKLNPITQTLSQITPNEELEGPRDRLTTIALNDPELEEAIAASDLIINTTSVGLQPTDPAPFPTRWIEPHHLVYDTIYNPAKTRLLRDAESQGARIANGLSLLLHQGALSLEYWLNCEAPINTMREGLKSALNPDIS